MSILGKVIMLTVLGKTDLLRRDYSIFKTKKRGTEIHHISDHQTLSVFVSKGAKEKLITT